jgi:PAS domain S-box-containing protein
MNEKTANSDPNQAGDSSNPALIRRGSQSRTPLKAAIIGGGKACGDLLALLSNEKLNRLNMEILGVADPNPDSPGISRARDMGIFTTKNFADLYTLPGLNLLIELTGSMDVRERMISTKPIHVSSIDHRGARLLWDLIQIEAEKQKLQKESEEKLQRFLESAHDIICIKDLEGRYLYVNPAATGSMGISPGKAIGRTDFDIFPERLAHAMAAYDREVLVQQKTLFSTERMRIKDQVRHFNTVRFPIVDDQGRMVSFAIIARDMTEEVFLQEEVRRNKEYLENILANSSDMIITTDLEGRIVTFNPGGERILGYNREEILGIKMEELWKVPDNRRRLMTEVEAKGEVNNYPGVLIAKDGHEVEISLSISQLRDSKGRVLGTVGISKDVTEENRLRRQLIEQERLAAVGQTVAGVTHCMKNVLNGLKGGAYMVNVGIKRSDSGLLEEGWGNVQKGIERISKLSLDMLSYCRDRKPNPVPTDPLKLARETAEILSKAAEQEGIEIVCHGDAVSAADLDPDTIGRALLNLISNAVDACREKSYSPEEMPLVEIRVKRDKKDLLFLVKDNGVGMNEEVRKRLFTRFFSTKEAGGTGLGLCVTHKIVEEHGGDLTLESSPGHGSTFTIVFRGVYHENQTGDTSKQ